MKNPKYPFGPATVLAPAAVANPSLTVENNKTIVNYGEMAAAMEIDLVIDAELQAGAELHIIAKSDGTARDITLGDGFTGVTIAGVINKTKCASFVFDGTSFKHVATTQLD